MDSSTDMRSELSNLCHEMSRQSPQQLIEESNLIWLSGTPAPADQGNIALNLDANTMALIPEKEIVKVERAQESKHFRVAVKPECQLVITQTQIRTACEVVSKQAASLQVRNPFFTFGDCNNLCDRIDNDCFSRIPRDPVFGIYLDPDAVQRCRNQSFDCTRFCSGLLFSEAAPLRRS